MDTLHDRLAELADDAPMGGAPAAELWARGKRAHRLRAAALAATLLVVGAVGTGIGVRLTDGDRSGLEPAGTVGITLPIEYPVGEELPDLGNTPGPLAAIWVAPGLGRGAPETVGLVAESGTFGTLPIDMSFYHGEPADVVGSPALSSDGRRIAYQAAGGGLVVRDLVSGEIYSPASEFKTRAGFHWVDATHLVGHVAGGNDGEGWVWEPGTATAPKLVNPYLVPYGGPDGFDSPALPRGVVTAGGPERVSLATDLIGAALDADGEDQVRVLEVDHVAGDALDGLLDRLGQRRVGEDVAGHLVGGEVPLLRQRQRRQQLGDVGADQVGAEDLVVLRVRDDLHEADAVAEAHAPCRWRRTGTSRS